VKLMKSLETEDFLRDKVQMLEQDNQDLKNQVDQMSLQIEQSI